MSKDWYVLLDGVKVPVTEEVYRAYYRPAWREAKRKEVRGDMECSLDILENAGFEAVSDEILVDELVADKLLLDELFMALDELTDDERSLINALFYQEKSERKVAAEIGLSQKAVNKKRHRILEKIKKLMGY